MESGGTEPPRYEFEKIKGGARLFLRAEVLFSKSNIGHIIVSRFF